MNPVKKLQLGQTDLLNLPLYLEKEYHNLYYYKDKLVKVIRYNLKEKETELLIKLERAKIHRVQYMDLHPSYLVPLAVSLDEEGYRGYIMENISDEINKEPPHDAKEIFSYFLKIEEAMEYGHRQDIIFPDLFSQGNIAYLKSGEVKFLDFDGWQVKNIPSGVSSGISHYKKVIRSNPKFYQNGLYTQDFDRLMLLESYLYARTNIHLFQTEDIPSALKLIFQTLKLDDQVAQYLIHQIFDFNSDKPIPKIAPILYAIENAYPCEYQSYQYKKS